MQRYFVMLAKGLCLWIVLTLLAGGCETLQFRDIQDQYNRAVETEIREIALIGEAGQSNTGVPVNTYNNYYEDVIRQLNKDYISKLDEKLKPTAYVMLTASYLRLGKLDEAENAAQKGLALKEISNSPRDRVYLTATSGIRQLESALVQYQTDKTRGDFDLDKYGSKTGEFDGYPVVLTKAYNNLKKALDQEKGSKAPGAIKAFVAVQQVRVLNHWKVIMDKARDNSQEIIEKKFKDTEIDETKKEEKLDELDKKSFEEFVKIRSNLQATFVSAGGDVSLTQAEKKECTENIIFHLSCMRMDQAIAFDEKSTGWLSSSRHGEYLNDIINKEGSYKDCRKKCFLP